MVVVAAGVVVGLRSGVVAHCVVAIVDCRLVEMVESRKKKRRVAVMRVEILIAAKRAVRRWMRSIVMSWIVAGCAPLECPEGQDFALVVTF